MYLGVDGGGTKTALALVDRDGNVRATHVAPGSYCPTLDPKELGTLLAEAVNATLGKAGASVSQVEFAFFGLPGYGEDSTVHDALDQLPAQCLPAGSFLCGNDMVCGWAGSLACNDGINVVAGTGSICYGERRGVVARCGGWGEVFSDEGSAYWIAAHGLNLFSRMSDGRAAVGPLYDLVKRQLQITQDLDLCGYIYTRLVGNRARIAQLCGLVFEAAAGGDAQAALVITQAADELALMVDTICRQLGFTAQERVPVSYSGGVFNNTGRLLLDRFSLSLQSRRSGYQITEPAFPPAIGAALYAAKRHGQPLSDVALSRLRAQSGVGRLPSPGETQPHGIQAS